MSIVVPTSSNASILQNVEGLILIVSTIRLIISLFVLFAIITFFLSLGPLFEFFSSFEIDGFVQTVTNLAVSSNCGVSGLVSGIILITSAIVFYIYIFGYIDSKGRELPANEVSEKNDGISKLLASMKLVVVNMGGIFQLAYLYFLIINGLFFEFAVLMAFFIALFIPNFYINGYFNRIINDYDSMCKLYQFKYHDFKDLDLKNAVGNRKSFEGISGTMISLFILSLLTIYLFFAYNFNILSTIYVIFIILVIYYDLSVINKMPVQLNTIVLKRNTRIEPVFILYDSPKGYLDILTKDEKIRLMKDSIEYIIDFNTSSSSQTSGE